MYVRLDRLNIPVIYRSMLLRIPTNDFQVLRPVAITNLEIMKTYQEE